MWSVEAIKFSANASADVSYQYKQNTEKLGDRDKQVAKRFGVIRRGKKCEAITDHILSWKSWELETCQH